PNVVRSMAVPATRRLHVAAQRTQLRVEGVAVGGEFIFVAIPADRRGLHAEGRFRGLQNCVRGMAVAADRRLEIAFGNGLTVDTGLVVVIDLGVAVAAGLWNIRFISRALRIG